MPQYFPDEVRKYGFWKALRRLGARRHVLVLVSQIALALAVAYSFHLERVHSNENRSVATANTRRVLVQACEQNTNSTRSVLRLILVDNETQIDARARKGLISPSEARDEHNFLNQEIARLHPVDCQALYRNIK